MSDYPKVTYKRHTFLSSLAMGFSAIVITIIVSCTVLIIYGIHFIGERPQKLVSLAREVVEDMPEVRKNLPPLLSDVLDDRRDPGYVANLEIKAVTALTPDEHKTVRTKIEVLNKGSEIVSLLGLRIVVFGPNGEMLSESNEWAATPVAADEQPWRGPLMPGSRRHFVSNRRSMPVFLADQLRTEYEITHLRIWNNSEAVGAQIEDAEFTQAEKNVPSDGIQTLEIVY